jgi:hypothetical protein
MTDFYYILCILHSIKNMDKLSLDTNPWKHFIPVYSILIVGAFYTILNVFVNLWNMLSSTNGSQDDIYANCVN